MKVMIAGAAGKMGREIATLIQQQDDVEIVAGIDRHGEKLPFQVFPSFEKAPSIEADVLIDFSLPELCLRAVRWASEHRIPLVSGTTGLSENEKAELEKAAEKIPLLWSPNMSLGIAWLHTVIAQLASLEGFDFQIEEAHHRFKKDKPSGTAVFLQEALERAVGRPLEAPLSIRGGGVFGIHKVHAMSLEETISLEHVALNRTVFARGALRAAQWIVDRSPGLYRLRDVLERP